MIPLDSAGVRLVFAGTPDVAVPSLQALLESDHEVVAVVTRPDAPSGRGRRLQASPVAERAAREGLEILRPERPRDPDFIARLTELAPDCCPVVAYGALIPQQVIDIPAHGWVNLHFSLLPAWRGAAPVQHAVINGDPVTGAATFSLVRSSTPGRSTGRSPNRSAPRTPPATCCNDCRSRERGCWWKPWTASPPAISSRYRSRPRGSVRRPRSPSRTPRSTGPTAR
ncbi:methionyl-tRNA formyltransferase [Microlunatus endophyticus]